MRARLLLLIVTMLCISACLAAGAINNFEFRLVLAPSESRGKVVDVIKKGPGYIYVHKLPYLADRDIEKVEMLRSANVRGRLLVGFVFNEEGARRLHRLINKYGTKRIGIFSDGKLITAVSVLPPYFLGDRVVIRWPGTEDELRKFAIKVNHKPPGLIALYIEETGRYNDVAAEAWAAAYENINKYLEAKARQIAYDRSVVESLREE